MKIGFLFTRNIQTEEYSHNGNPPLYEERYVKKLVDHNRESPEGSLFIRF